MSSFGTSLFLVKEKHKLRAVEDYPAWNGIKKRSNSLLRRIDEMFDRIWGARCLLKLDLKTGLHQIRVQPEDMDKTALINKHVQFEYLVLPMRLCNATATYQTVMNQVFKDCIVAFMVI